MIDQQFTAWSDRRGLANRLDPSQISQLLTYVRVLAEWNLRLNLTGFSLTGELDTALDRLVLEPVLASESVDKSARRLVDVGSGSGSPAIPLLISAPWLELTMVESRQRKSVFLREAVRAVGLRATVVTSRLEDLAATDRVELFDAASLRGVRLDEAIGVALAKLIQSGGQLLYFDSIDGPSPRLSSFINEPPAVTDALPGFRLSPLRRI